MLARVPMPSHRPGVCYAVADGGVELPVIDVTHPAFAVHPGEAELAALTTRALEAAAAWGRRPAVARWLLRQLFLRRGALTGGIARARGTFLAGLPTYLLKLGPDNLGGDAGPIDRRVAATLPCLSMRMRLQQVARLLAEGVAPALERDPARPLVLLDLAGGPGADGFNALLVLRRERPGLLEGRRTRIRVLDLDATGPAFGARAVASLAAEGGPLRGLDVALEHAPYDWRAVERLPSAAGELGEAAVACSSEGGLFEYGTDAEIAANLAALHALTPPDATLAGSLARADEPARTLNQGSGAALHPRPPEAFEALAGSAGWVLARRLDCPLSHDVGLRKA